MPCTENMALTDPGINISHVIKLVSIPAFVTWLFVSYA